MIQRFKRFADKSLKENSSFVTYKWSDKFVVKGKQTFAIYGSIAYDVSKSTFEGGGKICVPIKSKYLAAFPEEGSGGIMGCFHIKRVLPSGKCVNKITDPSFVSCGWLHTCELDI